MQANLRTAVTNRALHAAMHQLQCRLPDPAGRQLMLIRSSSSISSSCSCSCSSMMQCRSSFSALPRRLIKWHSDAFGCLKLLPLRRNNRLVISEFDCCRMMRRLRFPPDRKSSYAISFHVHPATGRSSVTSLVLTSIHICRSLS
jgi:hypothetical protein